LGDSAGWLPALPDFSTVNFQVQRTDIQKRILFSRTREEIVMTKHITALVFIFISTAFAWVILGSVTHIRTDEQDGELRHKVGRLWGNIQRQHAPAVYMDQFAVRVNRSSFKDSIEFERFMSSHAGAQLLSGSDIDVKFHYTPRKKGLLWYSTYGVDFNAEYTLTNDADSVRDLYFVYSFPDPDGVYDNFRLTIDDAEITTINPQDGCITEKISCEPGQVRRVGISYRSQGTDQWWYVFGTTVKQLRNFHLTMETDFGGFDFPENAISPTDKTETSEGWKLDWQYANLISGVQIGLDMPKRLNPGPFVGKVTFFAPVSLFLFFFLLFIITAIKGIKLHPMNYFFVAAAFFSFHLLLAYLVDHVDIHLSMAICSVVSIFLVVSYMRLVVGPRFAFVETGLSQFVYLVLFSYAFFLTGYTGLSITVVCILTLFIVMQFTAKLDWSQHFQTSRGPATASGPGKQPATG
jgi:hypothetical protein